MAAVAPNAPPVAMTQGDFVALWKRITPREYWGPIEAAGGGYGYEEVLSDAVVFARASQAVVRLDTDARLDTAPGGAYAEVQVEITRSAAPAEVLTVGEGSRLRTEDGVEFLVTQGGGAAWAAGENSTKTVTARSVRQSYQTNVRAAAVTEIVEIAPPGQDSAEGTLAAMNPAAATGGAPDMLSLIGKDRGCPRWAGEETESYRERIRRMPDIITPAALRRLVERVCKPYGIAYRLVEGINVGLACGEGACGDGGTTLETVMGPGPHGRGLVFAAIGDISGVLNEHTGGFMDDMACGEGACGGSAIAAEAFYEGLNDSLRQSVLGGVRPFVVLEE